MTSRRRAKADHSKNRKPIHMPHDPDVNKAIHAKAVEEHGGRSLRAFPRSLAAEARGDEGFRLPHTDDDDDDDDDDDEA